MSILGDPSGWPPDSKPSEPEAEDESLLHQLPTPDVSSLPVMTKEARKAG
jgi:hypothetical protein